jgi:hypothetical protein
MSTTDLPIHDIIKRAVVVDVPKNSVIVVSAKTDADTVYKIGAYMQTFFPSNPILFIVDCSDPTLALTTLSEEEMNKFGWYKKE